MTKNLPPAVHLPLEILFFGVSHFPISPHNEDGTKTRCLKKKKIISFSKKKKISEVIIVKQSNILKWSSVTQLSLEKT